MEYWAKILLVYIFATIPVVVVIGFVSYMLEGKIIDISFRGKKIASIDFFSLRIGDISWAWAGAFPVIVIALAISALLGRA